MDLPMVGLSAINLRTAASFVNLARKLSANHKTELELSDVMR